MSVITIIWSMIASACLTLAIIYLVVWFRNRAARAYLFFSLTAIATTGLAFIELWRMRAETPAELLTALTLMHVPLFVWLVSVTWFVRFYLGAGRLWLAWTIVGLRLVSLAGNLMLGQDPTFRPVTLRHISFLGELVTVGSAPNPLTPLTQFATVLVMLFVADAAVTAWRRGERRKALMVGGSVEFFLLVALGQATLAVWAGVRIPVLYSVPYLGLVVVMAYELIRDVLRAGELVRDLQVSETGLRESEERMALAVDVADLAIWTRDLDYSNIWASERWRTMFGFSASEILDAEAIQQRVHPEDLPALLRAQERALAGADHGSYQIEYRLALPDGSVRWISSSARVETDGAGRPSRMRGASRDITKRKHREDELLLLRQEVAHAGRVSMLGQLSAALAHEINQPLGAILRNAEAAELFLNHPSPDLDEIRAILADIRKDDVRAGAVIDRMRGMLKRRDLEARAIPVEGLIGEVLAMVRLDAQSRQVQVLVNLPIDLGAVRGDRVHLQQVLLNLLINGMDAINEGPSGERRVQVSARVNDAGMIEFSVADSGHGIPPDRLSQVFDPFFTTKANGMGMGLPISRTIIEVHGGKLWAENDAAGGAVFRFTLPIAQPEAA